MGPCLFLLVHLFCLSHRKIRLTMSMDNVGLKYVFWGLELHDHYDIFFVGVNQSDPGRVHQQPPTYFKGHWDNFMD